MSSLGASVLSTPRRRAIAIWLTIGLTVCIGALTLVPMNVPQDTPGNDKIHHMLAFGSLILPCAALYPKALYRLVLAAAAYGAVIEFIQPLVGRSGEFTDFIADLAGIGIGAMLGLGVNYIAKSLLASRRRSVPSDPSNVIKLYDYRRPQAAASDRRDHS